MEKRPLVGVFLAIILGILLGEKYVGGIVVTALFATITVMRRGSKKSVISWLLIMAGFALGFLQGTIYQQHYGSVLEELSVCEQEKTPIEIHGMVQSVKEGESSIKIRLSHCILVRKNTSKSIPDYIFYQKTNTKEYYKEGTYVAVWGIPISFSTSRNEGGYDEKWTCYTQGIVGKCVSPQAAVLETRGLQELYGSFLGNISDVKKRVETTFFNHMENDNAGILAAMCLGDKSGIEGELYDKFSKAGVAHVLAISGVHVSIVGMMFLKIFRKGRFGVITRTSLAFFSVVIFVMGVGSSASSFRAMIMFGIVLFSMNVGRAYDGMSAMSLAGSVILLKEPYCLFSIGFQFSFLAVAGVFLMQELLQKKYKKIHPLIKGMFISLNIWVITLPLVAWYQYQIPLYSVVLNILIIPLVTPLLMTGLLAGGLGVLGFENICGVMLGISETIMNFMKELIRIYLKIPGGVLIVGKPALIIILLFYATCVTVLFCGFRKKNLLIYTAIMPFILLIVVGNQWMNNQVVFLDVGQGDGIYLESSDGNVFMVDGGSSSEKQIGRYTIEPFLKCQGRRKIDAWFISHCDEDHVSGVKELLERHFQIEYLCFSEGVVENSAYEEILSLAKKNGTDVVHLENGAELDFGEVSFLAWGQKEGDLNDRSMILLAIFGKEEGRYLFAGDISEKTEREMVHLVKAQLKENRLNVMKANHHGSKYSNCKEWLEELKPEKVVISCGEGNRYGHPHKEVIDRIKEIGATIFCTMEQGEVKIEKECLIWYN